MNLPSGVLPIPRRVADRAMFICAMIATDPRFNGIIQEYANTTAITIRLAMNEAAKKEIPSACPPHAKAEGEIKVS